MNINIIKPEDLPDSLLSEFVIDLIHRTQVHETLWFRETEHQFGLEKALDIMDNAWSKTIGIIEKRYTSEHGIDFLTNNNLNLIKNMNRNELLKLSVTIAKNWLAQDGVWFQSIENKYGINDAKRCNDSTWARFSPFEAWSVKRLLKMQTSPGIEGLATALNFRLYGRLNKQNINIVDDNTLVFEMNDCRVQSARIRKGLPDYPCKSAGLVEYSRFAEFIDHRLKTSCLGCPPDEHPTDWFCAWRFEL